MGMCGNLKLRWLYSSRGRLRKDSVGDYVNPSTGYENRCGLFRQNTNILHLLRTEPRLLTLLTCRTLPMLSYPESHLTTAVSWKLLSYILFMTIWQYDHTDMEVYCSRWALHWYNRKLHYQCDLHSLQEGYKWKKFGCRQQQSSKKRSVAAKLLQLSRCSVMTTFTTLLMLLWAGRGVTSSSQVRVSNYGPQIDELLDVFQINRLTDGWQQAVTSGCSNAVTNLLSGLKNSSLWAQKSEYHSHG